MICLNCEVVDALHSFNFEDRLKSLQEVELMRDEAGAPIFFTGNSVVLVRVTHRGVERAMRCYKVDNPYLDRIYDGKSGRGSYFGKEFNVSKFADTEKYIDVVLCDWVEGYTLSKGVEVALRGDGAKRGYKDVGNNELRNLSRAFDALALQVVEAEWSHGDISLDNIIVCADGSMRLIDFDSMYLPTLRGLKSLSLGTPQFQSVQRTEDNFDSTTDHFSLMLLSVALRALSEEEWLHAKYPFIDGLLLDGRRVCDDDYSAFEAVKRVLACSGAFAHYRMAHHLYCRALTCDNLKQLFEYSLITSANEKGCCWSTMQSYRCSSAWGFEGVGCCGVVIPAMFDDVLDFENGEAEVVVAGERFAVDEMGRVTRHIDSENGWL